MGTLLRGVAAGGSEVLQGCTLAGLVASIIMHSLLQPHEECLLSPETAVALTPRVSLKLLCWADLCLDLAP